MRRIVIGTIHGIAPRYTPELRKGYAQVAHNVDLADGKLSPARGNRDVAAGSGNTLHEHGGSWLTGTDRYYLSWPINNHDLLFFLDGGTLKKTIAGVTADAGQDAPEAPTTALNGAGDIADTVQYALTWTRDVGGFTDQSPLGALSGALVADSNQVNVTRPEPPALVTHWNLFRVGELTGVLQLVATLPVDTATYTDNLTDLGPGCTTYYTSAQGVEIVWAKPPELTGITRKPHSGMLFGWKGSTLYWSEPGFPDAWPAAYTMNFPDTIKTVMVFGGSVAVLLASSPFRVDGTHPELLQQSEPLGEEPCIGTAACATSKGILYLSDSGIALFNLYETQMVTGGPFDEAWFKQNIEPAGAILAENDGVTWLFHSAGCLRYAHKEWTTRSTVATAAYKRPSDGGLYAIVSGRIVDIDAGATGSYTWRSGHLTHGGEDDVPWDRVIVAGSGDVALTIRVDDEIKATKTMDFSTDRGRRLGLRPEDAGRTLDVEFIGTGTVKEVTIHG